MKKTILLFVILIVSCVRLNAQSNNQNNSFTDSIQRIKFDTSSYFKNRLIGEWDIYSTNYTTTTIDNKQNEITNEESMLCNQCPRITFDSNMTATIKLSSVENIKWEVKGTKLKIINLDNSIKYKTFPDTDYVMTFNQSKGFTELTLTQKDKNYSKTLRR